MLLVILAAQTAFGVASPDETYQDCLRRTSAQFEASGDTARDVAKATIVTCIPLEVKPSPDNRLGQMTPDDQKQVTAMLRAAFEDRVAARIVRLRACRKTVGCKPNALPDKF